LDLGRDALEAIVEYVPNLNDSYNTRYRKVKVKTLHHCDFQKAGGPCGPGTGHARTMYGGVYGHVQAYEKKSKLAMLVQVRTYVWACTGL